MTLYPKILTPVDIWYKGEGGKFQYPELYKRKSMKTVLVTLAPGFEEIETITVVDIIRRAGARVTLAATVTGVLEGSRGIKVVPDEILEAVMNREFDLICLPGGATRNRQFEK